jgi:hypothetical protein
VTRYEHSRVRFRPDVGFELRCDECADRGGGACFWPLDLEFWVPRRGMTRCRACHTRRDTINQRRLREESAAHRERDVKRMRAYRRREKVRAFRAIREAVA